MGACPKKVSPSGLVSSFEGCPSTLMISLTSSPGLSTELGRTYEHRGFHSQSSRRRESHPIVWGTCGARPTPY